MVFSCGLKLKKRSSGQWRFHCGLVDHLLAPRDDARLYLNIIHIYAFKKMRKKERKKIYVINVSLLYSSAHIISWKKNVTFFVFRATSPWLYSKGATNFFKNQTHPCAFDPLHRLRFNFLYLAFIKGIESVVPRIRSNDCFNQFKSMFYFKVHNVW